MNKDNQKHISPNKHTCIGRIVGVFGLTGFLKIEVLSDFPERFQNSNKILIHNQEFVIESHFWTKNQCRIKLVGVDSVEEAEKLRWEYIFVPEEQKPKLRKDEYFAKDLIGLIVIDKHQGQLGKVEEIIQGPAQDLIRVKQILIPAVKKFVKKIDLNEGVISVELLPGMTEVN